MPDFRKAGPRRTILTSTERKKIWKNDVNRIRKPQPRDELILNALSSSAINRTDQYGQNFKLVQVWKLIDYSTPRTYTIGGVPFQVSKF